MGLAVSGLWARGGAISDAGLKRSASNDGAAVAALSGSFRASLNRYFARRVREPEDVEDMVQEVFERLLRRGDVGSLEHVGGYVFETASSVLLDRLRKRRTRHLDDHEEFNCARHGGEDFSPEHVLLARERLACATAALMELPENTRVIFVLRRVEGMKYRDIAARFRISVSAVEKHMRRATVHLVQRMGR